MAMENYVRTDESAILRVIKDSLNVRLWAITMTLIVFAVLATFIYELSKPKPIVVIDSSTGRTFHSMTEERLTYNIMEKMAMRSSMQFCERFYNYTSTQIAEYRKDAVSMMSKPVFEKLPQNWIEDDNVKSCIKLNATGSFDWILKPSVIYAKDPNYITLCQFTVNVTIGGISHASQKINVKLYWQRLIDYDFYKLENGLLLVKYDEIADYSKELKEAINKINQ
jgi:hypothetical protein